MVRIEGILGHFSAIVTGDGFSLEPKGAVSARLEALLNQSYPPGTLGPGLRRYPTNVEARAAAAVRDFGGEIVEVRPPDDDVEIPDGAYE